MSSSADLHPHARALLADHYAAIDADLPALLELLFARSAGEDWHKAGTFKHHLLGVYRTLALWNQPREVRLLESVPQRVRQRVRGPDAVRP